LAQALLAKGSEALSRFAPYHCLLKSVAAMCLAPIFMRHFVCLVLFTLLPLGTSRRHIRNGDSHYDTQQQTNTLNTALEVSTDAREAFYPVGFGKGLLHRQAAYELAPQMRAPQGQPLSMKNDVPLAHQSLPLPEQYGWRVGHLEPKDIATRSAPSPLPTARADAPVMSALYPFFDRKRRSAATEAAAMQRRIADCNVMLRTHPSCHAACRTSNVKMQEGWRDGQPVEIEFIIKPDGRVEEKVFGVKGESCKELTKEIEKALGTVVDTKPTAEMFEQEVNVDVDNQMRVEESWGKDSLGKEGADNEW